VQLVRDAVYPMYAGPTFYQREVWREVWRRWAGGTGRESVARLKTVITHLTLDGQRYIMGEEELAFEDCRKCLRNTPLPTTNALDHGTDASDQTAFSR
jgi:hypothetical protein